jgi:hypothetical protein
MPDTSFTTRHAGVSFMSSSNLNILTLNDEVESDIEITETPDGEWELVIRKDGSILNGHDNGLTVIRLDWVTALDVAKAVDRRREQYEQERQDHAGPS